MSIQNTTEPVYGESFTLTCSATILPLKVTLQLLPKAVLEWLGPDGEVLTNNNNNIIVGEQKIMQNNITKTLLFNSLSFFNKDTYSCMVKVAETEFYNESLFYIDVRGKNAMKALCLCLYIAQQHALD